MRAHGRTSECGVGDGASWPNVAQSAGLSVSYDLHTAARSCVGRPLMARPNRPSEPVPEPNNAISTSLIS